MITEDYVSFETAKLMKKKGFDEATIGHYYTISEIPEKIKFFDSPISIYHSDGLIGCIQAPTLQMTMKWLREVHHYYIQVMLDGWACGGHLGYYVVVQKTDSDFEMMLSDVRERVFYDTPEEAAEDAIKYIVENLI